MPQFAAPRVEGVAPAVPEVVGVHDAERAGRRQCPRFRAAQENAVLAEPHALAVWAARQIEIASEHVTRVRRVSFEWIGRGASTALAEFATIVVSVARVIIPTRIEIHSRTTLSM